ncbi:MAG TPA: ABC transporter permease subunit [Patescibacteria group bacterium]|nr:ABC transporter permease subunit [Patescibacteria group bacterium]
MALFAPAMPRTRFRLTEVIILLFLFTLLCSVISLGAGMDVDFSPNDQPEISLDPSMLPYYAGRSLLRMFIAFGASLIFTLVYGYVAAKNRTAGKVMIPLLDMLQSVPVLGFLSVTIVGFMALFPGKLLGVECASIFAIFTGQAWNMAFSFYNSLTTIPKDLQEAADVLRMNWWQRFIRLEVPFSMIGLVWNSMMSFGGGWFFLAASEAISVLGENIRLPGVGSYLAAAIEAGDMTAIIASIITMIVMIIAVDQFFWRPIVVWSQRFKMELTESTDAPTSFVYTILHKSSVAAIFTKLLLLPSGKLLNWLFNHLANFSGNTAKNIQSISTPFTARFVKLLFAICFLWFIKNPAWEAVQLISTLDSNSFWQVIILGALTLLRVLLAVLLGALWTIPVGVWIGLNPKWAKFLQPLIQICASFPANMLFPFATILFIKYQINFECGSVALMMLGTQWYILFNVIAGTMSIPNDLHEAGAIFKLRGWRKWRTLILPSIFPFLITGAITASGGAWNASIVSELVSWHNDKLAATGLGAYISKVTEQGDWAGIIWGITVMCLFVVTINRFVWRRLYRLAEVKYHLD